MWPHRPLGGACRVYNRSRDNCKQSPLRFSRCVRRRRRRTHRETENGCGARSDASPDYSWPHTNPKRKRGRATNLPRLRFGLVCAQSVVEFVGPRIIRARPTVSARRGQAPIVANHAENHNSPCLTVHFPLASSLFRRGGVLPVAKRFAGIREKSGPGVGQASGVVGCRPSVDPCPSMSSVAPSLFLPRGRRKAPRSPRGTRSRRPSTVDRERGRSAAAGRA